MRDQHAGKNQFGDASHHESMATKPVPPPGRRRVFIGAMLLLLLPIAGSMVYVTAHRYGVYPSSSSNNAEWVLSDDTTRFVRELTVGFPFSKVSRQFDAYDMSTGEHLWTWVPEHTDNRILSISDDGSKMCVRTGGLFFVHEFDPPHRRLREVPLQWNINLPSDVFWIDDDTKWIYRTDGGYQLMVDLETGEEQQIAGATETYDFIGYWPDDDWYLTVPNTAGPAVPQKVYHRSGSSVFPRALLNIPEESRGFVFRNGTRLHFWGKSTMVDLESGETIELQLPVRPGDADGGCLARFTDELAYYHFDDQFRVTGATLMDSTDGKPGRYVPFKVISDSQTFHVFREDRFYQLQQNGEVAFADLNGGRHVIATSPPATWLRWTIITITSTVLWWIIWTCGMRQTDRSYQAVIDIALLYGLVFLASTIRLFTGSYDWTPNQPESALFFAATTSVIALLLLWFVFGSNNWRRRCTQAILVIALIFWVYLLLWKREGGWSMGILLPTFSVTSLLTLLLLIASGYRLTHTIGCPVKPAWVGRTVGIKQLVIWTLSFAVLFGVLRSAEMIIVSRQDFLAHLAEGVAAGILAMICVFAILTLRSKILGLAVSVIAFVCLTAGINQFLGTPPTWSGGSLFHPGGSFAVLFSLQTILLIASLLAVRANGYRLSRPGSDMTAGDPGAETA